MPETNTIKEAKVCKTCAFTRIADGKVVCVLHCCPVRAIDSCEDWKAYAPNSAAGPWQTGVPQKNGDYLTLCESNGTYFLYISSVLNGKWRWDDGSIIFWAEINMPEGK